MLRAQRLHIRPAHSLRQRLNGFAPAFHQQAPALGLMAGSGPNAGFNAQFSRMDFNVTVFQSKTAGDLGLKYLLERSRGIF